jgi:DNA mismatch repair ATPase MutS
MENYIQLTENLYTHQEFNNILKNELITLKNLYDKIIQIYELKYNIKKLGEIGSILKTFYQIYDDPIYNKSIMYSLGFHGYIDCIKGLQHNIKERKVNFTQFINKKNKNYKNNKNIFKNNYYACLKNDKHIKNTIQLNKNIIISGPNASGKTTIIKSVLINIIFTQQFGCGFYDSAKIKPYDHLHCYLNIPDTSGRDSLFQAEARRCKEIIDLINNNSNDYHFCAFDELYSGTNPQEATSSSIAFMNYIVKNTKLNTILTTHFIEVCNNLNNNEYIKNCYMDTIKKNNVIEYLYKMKNGISTIKGGINVLCDMNYPKEIIDNTLEISQLL